jgi:3-oxoacyl-[acyl-carrier-protein] synthase-3
VRATCLSFLVAFDMAASFLAAGTYKRILIVSPEVASVGLNKKQRESYTLLGDGAGAVVVALPEKGQASALVSARFGTWSQHADLCRIKGGGAKLYPTQLTDENRDDFLFEMDGVASYRAVAQVSPQFLADVLDGRDIDDVAYVIPHQASRLAIELMFQRRLKIPAERVVNVLAKYGNTIAASIPMAMHDAIEDGRIERGDLLLLAGSSAGLSLGGLLVVY